MPSPTDLSVSTKEDGARANFLSSLAGGEEEEEEVLARVVPPGTTTTLFEEEEVGGTLARSFKRINSCNNSYSSALTSTVVFPFFLKLLMKMLSFFSLLLFFSLSLCV
jgi:hypothetical protein